MSNKENKKYIKGGLWAVSCNIFVLFSSLILIMLAVRHLEKSQIGLYFLVLIIIQMGAALSDVGFRSTIIKFGSEAKDEGIKKHTVDFVLTTALMVSLLISFLVYYLNAPISNILAIEAIRTHKLDIAILVLLMSIYQLLMSALAAYKLFKFMSLTSASTELLKTILSIVMLYQGYGIYALIIPLGISRISAILVVMLKIKMGLRFTCKGYRQVYSQGGWLYTSSIISIVSAKISEIIITSTLGPAMLAIYSSALQVPQLTQKLFESVRPVLLSLFSTKKLEDFSEIITVNRWFTFILCFVGILIVTTSDHLVMIMLTDAYLNSVPVMKILSCWMVLSLINYLQVINMIGNNKASVVFSIACIQLAVVVPLSFYLVSAIGLEGAAISITIAAFATVAYSSWILMGRVLDNYLKNLTVILKSFSVLVMLVSIEVTFDIGIGLKFVGFIISCMLLLLVNGVSLAELREIKRRIVLPDYP
ncbi:MAG: oligosaccharide flippase family protein [Sedimenticola sp.]